MSTPQRLIGTVRTLRQGYGFIEAPGTKDHFFHKSNLTAGKHQFGVLEEGYRVEFTPGHDPDGRPRAEDVSVLNS